MRGKVSEAEKNGDLKREVAFGLRLLCTGAGMENYRNKRSNEGWVLIRS